MDDPSPTLAAPTAGAPSRRALWPLAAVAMVAIVGGGAGAYFGLRGAARTGSAPGVSPPARAFAAAAYDEASHQVVLFGGTGADGSALDDTWTWDGSAWTQQHPATSPAARAFAAMTYDPKAHDVMLVGGRSVSDGPTVCSGGIAAGGPNATPGVGRPSTACRVSQPSVFSDTWLWDGRTWRPGGPTPTLLPVQSPALGTDPTTGQVLMLGTAPGVGMNPACPSPAPSFPPGTPIPQVAIPCMTPAPPAERAWVWRGTSWAELTGGSPPSEQGLPVGDLGALATDPTSGHLVDVRAGLNYACGAPVSAATAMPCPVVEGSSGAGSSSGSAVNPTPPDPLITPPPVLPVPNATANAATASPVPVPVVPSPLPSALPVPMPTNFPAPGRVTCCSGSVTTWNGSSWSNPRTFSAGPQVISSGFAGDPAQHEMVAVTSLGTWTWDGSSWKAQHPATSPPPEEGGALVYDGVSGKLLRFGGELTTVSRSTSATAQPHALQVTDELWAWDGTTWSQLSGTKASPAPSPTPTPTFVPPSTPVPGSPAPTHAPLPTLPSVRCSPMAMIGPSGGTSAGANEGCAVPPTAVPSGGPTAPTTSG